jgi:hypothetical protein
MAVKRLVPLNQINGVAASATATINLPVGPRRYHALFLGYKTATVGGATEAKMASEMKEIRMNLDGVTQRRFSPQQLFDLNRQKGKVVTASASTAIPGYMSIYLTEPQRRTITQREATAWGMKGIGSFQIEIDLDSTASSPVINGFALIDDIDEVPGLIVKWKRETLQVSATGDLTYKLDTNRGDAYQSLTFIETTAGDIDNIELTWDGVQMYKDDENFAVEYLNSSDSTRVSKYRHVPLSLNAPENALQTIKRNQDGSLTKVGEFVAKLTMGAAANVTLIAERIGTPD